MDASTLLKADYLDILFDNRNKQYGSYELRKNYDKRVRKSILFIVVAAFVLSASTFIKNNDVVAYALPMIHDTVTLSQIIDIEHITPPPPAPAAASPAVENTIPTIIEDNEATKPPATVDDLKGKESGPVNAVGSDDGTAPAKSSVTGNGNSIAIPTPANNEIATWTEQMPEFQGNLAAYLQKNLRYPDLAKENNIEGRVVIQFVVNEDGSIGNAIIKKGIGGGCNEEALRVVNAMPKWKPGMQNGRAVKVYYTLPITFMLE